MDICHLKNAELEPTFQKHKGWFVLQSDTVKDDSGLLCMHRAGFVSITNDGRKSDGCHTKANWRMLGKTIWKISIGTRMRKIPDWECLFVHRKAMSFPFGLRGWHKNGWKEGKPQHLFGRNCWNSLIWQNQHHFLTMCTWYALNVNAKRTKVLLRKTEKCSFHEYLRSNWKVTRLSIIAGENSRLAWNVNDSANCRIKKDEQLCKVSTTCFEDCYFKKKKKE